jgi:hypothetical protein
MYHTDDILLATQVTRHNHGVGCSPGEHRFDIYQRLGPPNAQREPGPGIQKPTDQRAADRARRTGEQDNLVAN